MQGFIEVTGSGETKPTSVNVGYIVYFQADRLNGVAVTKIVLAHADTEQISTKNVFVREPYETVRGLIAAASR